MTNIQTPEGVIDEGIVSAMAAEMVEAWESYRDEDVSIHRGRFADWLARTFKRPALDGYLRIACKLSESDIADLPNKRAVAGLIATKYWLMVMAARTTVVVGLDEFKPVTDTAERRLRELAAYGSHRRVEGLWRSFMPQDFVAPSTVTLADLESPTNLKEQAQAKLLEDRDEFTGVRLDDGQLLIVWITRTDDLGEFTDEVSGETRIYRRKRACGYRLVNSIDDAKNVLRGVASHFRSQYEPEVVPEEQEQPFTVADLD